MLTKAELPDCPVATTVQLIGNKWKILIIRNLVFDRLYKVDTRHKQKSPYRQSSRFGKRRSYRTGSFRRSTSARSLFSFGIG